MHWKKKLGNKSKRYYVLQITVWAFEKEFRSGEKEKEKKKQSEEWCMCVRSKLKRNWEFHASVDHFRGAFFFFFSLSCLSEIRLRTSFIDIYMYIHVSTGSIAKPLHLSNGQESRKRDIQDIRGQRAFIPLSSFSSWIFRSHFFIFPYSIWYVQVSLLLFLSFRVAL